MADRVTFTRGAAERIARVVRHVELGNRDSSWSPPPPRDGGNQPINFRMATFTGAWSINTSKTVQLYLTTAATATLSVSNVMFQVSQMSTSTATPTVCAVARDRGAWYLVNVVHAEYDVLSGVNLQPTALQFSRNRILAVGVTQTTAAIAITECENEAASAEQLNWFFG